jgi:hypothetical protein
MIIFLLSVTAILVPILSGCVFNYFFTY